MTADPAGGPPPDPAEARPAEPAIDLAPAGGDWAPNDGSTASGRLAWRTVIAGAAVVTLVRPVSWAVGLAGFLAGGGLLVVATPVAVLPTPTGLQNALGGPVSSLVFGAPSSALLALIVGGLATAAVLLVAGTVVGAWAERQAIAIACEAAAAEAFVVPAPDLRGAPGAVRVALVRLLSLAPVAAVALLAWRPLYDAAYQELVLPHDLATPLPVRILAAVPGLVVALAVAWAVSDAAAAVGVRRLVLERRGVLGAWLLGWADLVRRPARVMGTLLAGLGVTLLLLGPALVAATLGWMRVRDLLLGGGDPVTALAAVVLWVATWLAALVLAGVAAAFRNAAWTLELPRASGSPRSAASTG